jgi:hypothetical protein
MGCDMKNQRWELFLAFFPLLIGVIIALLLPLIRCLFRS